MNHWDYLPSKELAIKTFLICFSFKATLLFLNWICYIPTKSRTKLNRTVSRYDNKVFVDVDCSSIDLCQKSITPFLKKKSIFGSIVGIPFLPVKYLYQSFIDKPFDNLSVICRLFILILIELKTIFFNSRVKKSDSKILYSQNIERFNKSLLNLIDKDPNSFGGSLKFSRPKSWLDKKRPSSVSIDNELANKVSSRFKIEYKFRKLKSNHLFLNLNKKKESNKDRVCEKPKNIIKIKVDQTTYSRKTSKNLVKLKNDKNKVRNKINVLK